jgi:hypothetical protein
MCLCSQLGSRLAKLCVFALNLEADSETMCLCPRRSRSDSARLAKLYVFASDSGEWAQCWGDKSICLCFRRSRWTPTDSQSYVSLLSEVWDNEMLPLSPSPLLPLSPSPPANVETFSSVFGFRFWKRAPKVGETILYVFALRFRKRQPTQKLCICLCFQKCGTTRCSPSPPLPPQ